MEDVTADDNFNPYLAYVAFGTFFFTVINVVIRHCLVPKSANNSPKQRWKWCNISTSLVHSTITGIWAPLSFYLYPSMYNDLISEFNLCVHKLVSFSIGYFIYDFIDMALYNMKRSTIELLVHHSCVIVCFGIAAHTRNYLPYGAIALIVEVNSIFLHARQLCIIQGMPKQTTFYRNIALLNVATFVMFRILLLAWMTRWLTENRDNISFSMFTCGSIGLATIFAMNILLFYKILNSDFLRPSSSSSSNQKLLCESNICNENAFHPVSKDVNRIMKSFFDEDSTRESNGNCKAVHEN